MAHHQDIDERDLYFQMDGFGWSIQVDLPIYLDHFMQAIRDRMDDPSAPARCLRTLETQLALRLAQIAGIRSVIEPGASNHPATNAALRSIIESQERHEQMMRESMMCLDPGEGPDDQAPVADQDPPEEKDNSMDVLVKKLGVLEARLAALESSSTVRAPFRVVDEADRILVSVKLDTANGTRPTVKLTIHDPENGHGAINLESAPGEEGASLIIREGAPGAENERGITMVSDGFLATWKGDQNRVIIGEMNGAGAIEVYPERGDNPVVTLYTDETGAALTLKEPDGAVRFQAP